MSDLEVKLQIDLLERQGDDARSAGQYATAEAFLAEAARLADAYADWPTRIRVHFYLADCHRMQQLHDSALTTYTWLISLTSDPQASSALTGTAELIYLYFSYLDFVEIGRYLPAMHTTSLHRVLNEAQRFLADIGHPEWEHNLYLQRGQLLKQEGRLAEARQALDTGLAMRRRTSDSLGYTLGSYLFQLAEVLIDLEDHDGANRYYREIWQGREHSLYVRRYAASGLGDIARLQKNWVEAEHWAREGLILAIQLQSPKPHYESRIALLPILLVRNKVDEAVREGATLWRWGRRVGTAKASHETAWHLCRVRLACVREAARVTTNPDDAVPAKPHELPPRLHQRAKRFLGAARRWLDRAHPLARRLDEQAGLTRNQDELRTLAQQLDALAAWLEGGHP